MNIAPLPELACYICRPASIAVPTVRRVACLATPYEVAQLRARDAKGANDNHRLAKAA